jgi:hypothetical protein
VLVCDCGGKIKPDATLYSLGLYPCRCNECGLLQTTEDFPDRYEGV